MKTDKKKCIQWGKCVLLLGGGLFLLGLVFLFVFCLGRFVERILLSCALAFKRKGPPPFPPLLLLLFRGQTTAVSVAQQRVRVKHLCRGVSETKLTTANLGRVRNRISKAWLSRMVPPATNLLFLYILAKLREICKVLSVNEHFLPLLPG